MVNKIRCSRSQKVRSKKEKRLQFAQFIANFTLFAFSQACLSFGFLAFTTVPPKTLPKTDPKREVNEEFARGPQFVKMQKSDTEAQESGENSQESLRNAETSGDARFIMVSLEDSAARDFFTALSPKGSAGYHDSAKDLWLLDPE